MKSRKMDLADLKQPVGPYDLPLARRQVIAKNLQRVFKENAHEMTSEGLEELRRQCEEWEKACAS